MVDISANGLYKYDHFYLFCGTIKTLDQWVQESHLLSCEENRYTLKRGSFEYDTIAISLIKVFSSPTAFVNKTKMVEIIYQGQYENYIYWRDNKPWLPIDKSLYIKPSNPFEDDILEYTNLSTTEKDKLFTFVSILNIITGNRY